MPKPFAVRIRRLADESEQTMPYKSYLYIKDDIDDVTHQKKFELVGEVDASGKLVPGSPNLQPQHQTVVPQAQKPVEHAANVGNEQAAQAEQAQAQETPKKRGRRPAQVTLQETQA